MTGWPDHIQLTGTGFSLSISKLSLPLLCTLLPASLEILNRTLHTAACNCSPDAPVVTSRNTSMSIH